MTTALQHYSRLHSIDEADARYGARAVSAPAPQRALSVVIRAAVKPPASGSSHTTARHAAALLASNTKQAPDNRALAAITRLHGGLADSRPVWG